MQLSYLDDRRIICYKTLIKIIMAWRPEDDLHSITPDMLAKLNANCETAEKLGISDSDNILRIAKQLKNYIEDKINAS